MGGTVTASSPSLLTDLQRRFLCAFAARTSAFFLTGGAVLAGWVLGHRRTEDLDLFTTDDSAMDEGDRILRAAAAEIGASVESVQTNPDFKRYLLRVGSESVVVDLVRDRVPQLRPKVDRGGLLTDSTEEIVANKICTMVSRSEIRDLVDLYFLERAGFQVESFLSDAMKKDGGVTPATIAWILSGLKVPDTLPEGLAAETLRGFVRDLEARMRRLSVPLSPRS
jgi:hypothetical protein